MGGVTKSDFEWRFIFEKSALKVEFQTRLFVFGVHPAWSFNLELFCIFGYFWLFLCGLLMPSEGALWALSCWMAPSFPLKFAKKSVFIKENWPSKKIFPLRGQNPGGDASNWPLRRAEKCVVLGKNQKIFHVFSFCCFFTFLAKFLGIFDFLALLSARSRRVLANREERIKKKIFWPFSGRSKFVKFWCDSLL